MAIRCNGLAVTLVLAAVTAALADDAIPRFAIVVNDSCVLTEYDIECYEIESHLIHLTADAYSRCSSFTRDEFLVPFKAFQIRVDSVVVYSGTVVSPIISYNPTGPTIVGPVGAYGSFFIGLGRDDGADPRDDERIVGVMRSIGVLKE